MAKVLKQTIFYFSSKQFEDEIESQKEDLDSLGDHLRQFHEKNVEVIKVVQFELSATPFSRISLVTWMFELTRVNEDLETKLEDAYAEDDLKVTCFLGHLSFCFYSPTEFGR